MENLIGAIIAYVVALVLAIPSGFMLAVGVVCGARWMGVSI